MMFFRSYPLFDEFEEGFNGSSGSDEALESGAAAPVETSDPAAAPTPFIGDYDEQRVLDLLNLTGEMPDRLTGLESRFQESLSPLQKRLEEVQAALGSRVAFQPKLDKFKAKLSEYDPKLGEAVDDLISELTESLQVNPIDKASLEPHITPYLSSLQEQSESQMASALLSLLPFSADEVVARDADGNPTDPKTALQKDFYSWWGLQDQPTQQALQKFGMPYFSAMQRFSKWRENRTKDKGAAAGELSNRLASGQSPTSTTRQPVRHESPTDAFNAGFEAVLSELQAR
jgi:hypothetical protein